MRKLFKEVTLAAKSVAGYNDETGLYEKPSLALKIGHTLKKCAKLVKTAALIVNDSVTIEASDRFFQLCELEWSDAVSAAALKTLTNRQRNKVSLLPLSEDVKKLHAYLHREILHGTKSLSAGETECSETAWRSLAEAVLTQLISFNRRRAGEVSRMTIDDYNRRSSPELVSDVQQSFGIIERNLCKVFSRVELTGKRGRTVPVLLTTNMQQAVDLLIINRARCGVKAENPYLFAYSHSDNYLRGSDCLRVASSKCLAVHPERLRSTKLRKHVATLCQVLNMKKNELDLLAQFMGHNIAVHREFYRLPNDTLQMAHIAKVFLLMENGTLADQHGKSLKDITLDKSVDIVASDVSEDETDDQSEQTADKSLDIPPRTHEMVSDDFESIIETSVHDDVVQRTISACEQDEPSETIDIPPRTHEMVSDDLESIIENSVNEDVAERTTSTHEQGNPSETTVRSKGPPGKSLLIPKRHHSDDSTDDSDDEWIPSASKTPKPSTSKKVHKIRKQSTHKHWTPDEQNAINRHFTRHILLGQVPKKAECENCRVSEQGLSSRNWKSIKFFVYNAILKHKKMKLVDF